MEILAVLLFFVILFLIISLNRNLDKRFTELEVEIRRLTEKLNHRQPQQTPENIIAPTVIPVPEKEIKTEDKWESGFKPMQEPFAPVPPNRLRRRKSPTSLA